jgi:hypothetical protein
MASSVCAFAISLTLSGILGLPLGLPDCPFLKAIVSALLAVQIGDPALAPLTANAVCEAVTPGRNYSGWYTTSLR